MRRPNPHEERLRRLGEARDAFTRAAAALTEPTLRENLGTALFYGALGMLRMAQGDPDERALHLAQGMLDRCRTAGHASQDDEPTLRDSEEPSQ